MTEIDSSPISEKLVFAVSKLLNVTAFFSPPFLLLHRRWIHHQLTAQRRFCNISSSIKKPLVNRTRPLDYNIHKAVIFRTSVSFRIAKNDFHWKTVLDFSEFTSKRLCCHKNDNKNQNFEVCCLSLLAVTLLSTAGMPCFDNQTRKLFY